MTRILKHTFIICFFAIFLSPLHALASQKVLNIRHWAAPDHVRVVIDTSDEIPHDVSKTGNIVLIDFKNTGLSETIPREIVLNKPGIEKIVVESLPHDTVRIGLTMTGNVDAKVFKLKKFQEKPDRVVIDIGLPDVEKKESKEREQVKNFRKDKIVVIDPGHGGEDPGAVGRRGTQEKWVVLQISRKLRDLLNRKEGYRAFLTRNGDYYVPFKKRLKIAREYGADLFLSIHADAFRLRGARGSSVYCLSLKGASSEAARILARYENLADVIGGDPNGENSEESDPIILNMFQTNTINASKIYGKIALKHLNRVNQVKFSEVQGAPFRVLKLPEIPSLLIETAYISNPSEEKLLRSKRFQAKIAQAVAESVVEYLPVQPAPPKIIVTKSEVKEKSVDKADGETESNTQPTVMYVVKKGDSLGKIANRNNTTIGVLLKLNNMKLHDSLHVGRRLKLSVPEGVSPNMDGAHSEIPSHSAKSEPVRKSEMTYRVKRGDTLSGIAMRYKTTIGTLLKLNRMKMDDPLYVGRKLIVAGGETQAGKDVKPLVAKVKTYTYKVKRGDTLDKIAKRCGASVSELCRLNQMKRSDVLYVNRILKIPSNPSI